MRRYLDTESGKAEVNLLLQVVRESESRTYLSLRDPNDESEVTKEIDSIHNRRKMVKLRNVVQLYMITDISLSLYDCKCVGHFMYTYVHTCIHTYTHNH